MDTPSLEVLIYVFDQTLRLLHPFHALYYGRIVATLAHQGLSLAIEKFPIEHAGLNDDLAEQQV